MKPFALAKLETDKLSSVASCTRRPSHLSDPLSPQHNELTAGPSARGGGGEKTHTHTHTDKKPHQPTYFPNEDLSLLPLAQLPLLTGNTRSFQFLKPFSRDPRLFGLFQGDSLQAVLMQAVSAFQSTFCILGVNTGGRLMSRLIYKAAFSRLAELGPPLVSSSRARRALQTPL